MAPGAQTAKPPVGNVGNLLNAPWDSSDPKRNPPPLPLNPGGSPRTEAPPRRDSSLPVTSSQSSPTRPASNITHRRMNSGNVREMGAVFNGGSPTKSATLTKDLITASKELFAARERNENGTSPSKDKTPKVTLRTLKSNPFDAPLTDSFRAYEFETIGQQLSNITHIASQLQKEMNSLSRRSKDNATDLLTLKEATKSRDEDIRKSLKNLVATISNMETTGAAALLASPTAQSLASSAVVSSSSGAASRSTGGFGLGPEMQILERILRDMGTKDGEDRLLNNLHELKRVVTKELPTKANEVKILGMVEEVKDEVNSMTHGLERLLNHVANSVAVDSGVKPLNTRSRISDASSLGSIGSDVTAQQIRKLEERIESGKVATTEAMKGIIDSLRTEMANYGRATNVKIENLLSEVVKVGHISRANSPAPRTPLSATPVLGNTDASLTALHAVSDQTRRSNKKLEEIQAVVEDFRMEVKEATSTTADNLVELSKYLEDLTGSNPHPANREDAKEVRKILEVVRTGVQGMNDRLAHFESQVYQRLADAQKTAGGLGPEPNVSELRHEMEDVRKTIMQIIPQMSMQLTDQYEKHLATVELRSEGGGVSPVALEQFQKDQFNKIDRVVASLKEETIEGLRDVRGICKVNVNTTEQIVEGVEALKDGLLHRIERLVAELRDDTLTGIEKIISRDAKQGISSGPILMGLDTLKDSIFRRLEAAEQSLKGDTVVLLKTAISEAQKNLIGNSDKTAEAIRDHTAKEVRTAVVDVKSLIVTELTTHGDGAKEEVIAHIDSSSKQVEAAVGTSVGTALAQAFDEKAAPHFQSLSEKYETQLAGVAEKISQDSKAASEALSGHLSTHITTVSDQSRQSIIEANTKVGEDLKAELAKLPEAVKTDVAASITASLPAAFDNVKGELVASITSTEEKISGTVAEVKKAVGGLQESELKEHKSTQKVVADVLSAVEGLTGEWKGQQPKLFNALSELKYLLQQAEKVAEKKKEKEKEKKPEVQAVIPAFDDTEVKEKLDRLVAHSVTEARHFPQLELLDTIHQQVRGTSSDISEFIALQTEYMKDESVEKTKIAHDAELKAEKARTEQIRLEESSKLLKEQNDALIAQRNKINQENIDMAARKLKLAGEVAALETALSLRKEELLQLEDRTEQLEKRLLHGVIEQSRAILIAKSNNKAAFTSNSLRRSMAPPADIPARAVININTTPGRRHLSLNQINTNSPSSRDLHPGRISIGGAGSFQNQNFAALKRSQSVKQPEPEKGRKSSWGKKLGKAFAEGKENVDNARESVVSPTDETSDPSRSSTPLGDVQESEAEDPVLPGEADSETEAPVRSEAGTPVSETALVIVKTRRRTNEMPEPSFAERERRSSNRSSGRPSTRGSSCSRPGTRERSLSPVIDEDEVSTALVIAGDSDVD